jgi:hypothetical protein
MNRLQTVKATVTVDEPFVGTTENSFPVTVKLICPAAKFRASQSGKFCT